MLQGLSQLNKDSRNLVLQVSNKVTKTKRLTVEEKRNMSTSAWARSTASKCKMFQTPIVVTSNTGYVDLDVYCKAENAIKVRSAAYTIGKRPREDMKNSQSDYLNSVGPSVGTYEVKFDAISTSKRLKDVKFGTPIQASPNTFILRNDTIQVDGAENMNKVIATAHHQTPRWPSNRLTEQSIRSYSFSKSTSLKSQSPSRRNGSFFLSPLIQIASSYTNLYTYIN